FGSQKSTITILRDVPGPLECESCVRHCERGGGSPGRQVVGARVGGAGHQRARSRGRKGRHRDRRGSGSLERAEARR
ncbi:unnamed protein product, partial [Effrenium voratum]